MVQLPPSKLPNVGTTIFTVMSALANEHGAINLSQGFPNYSSDPKLLELVSHYMKAGYNQYAPMAGVMELRTVLAKKIFDLYQLEIDPKSEITITAGATQAIYTAITTFVNVGDEVIIIEPAFDIYRPGVELNGGVPVIYEMEAPDYQVDWEKLARLITPKTRMLIINNPNNPTGRIFHRSDLLALDKILTDTHTILLSDEVYEHLVFDDAPHESVLAYPNLWQRAMAVFSFGKTFHNTGWKMGYIVGPEPLMNDFRKVHQFNVFCCNTPVQYALAEFMQDSSTYLGLPAFYQQKRDYFTQLMEQLPFKPLPCEGTYYQLYRYGHLTSEGDRDFAIRMTTEFGVAAIPISVFYSSNKDEKVIRLCFAKTTAVLDAAIEKLHQVLKNKF